MTRRDWFGVGVRLLGVWELLVAIDEVRMAVTLQSGIVSGSTGMGVYIVHALVSAAVGLYLLSGAPQLVAIAFRGHGGTVCSNCGYDLTGHPGQCPECGSVPMKASAE